MTRALLLFLSIVLAPRAVCVLVTRWKQGVEPVIRQMEYLVSERVYGGHVFMAGGVVGKTQLQLVPALIYLTVSRLTTHYLVVVLWFSDFIGCLFYDLEILTSFYDRWIFGGDILVGKTMYLSAHQLHVADTIKLSLDTLVCGGQLLEGQVTFTGCTWFMVTIFGTENGVGMNGLVLGGR